MFSRDASLVAAVDENGVSHLRRVDGGATLYSAPAGFSIVGISDDGTLVVETDTTDETVGTTTRVVRTDNATTVTELDAVVATRAVFSPDGDKVVVSTAFELTTLFRVFDVSDGRTINEMEAVAFWHQVTPEGRRLVVGGRDGVVRIYDLGQVTAGSDPDDALTTIVAHSSEVYQVAISPDGTKLLTAAFSEPARLWDLTSGDLLGQFGTDADITGVGFHTSEPWVLVAESGIVTSYTYDPDELVQVARDRLTRSLTEEECALYLLRPCDTTD